MLRTADTIRPLEKLAQRRMLRVHLALAQRPAFAAAQAPLLTTVAQGLSKRLGSALTLHAKLLPVSLTGADALGSPAAFVLLRLEALGAIAVLEIELPLASGLVDLLAGGTGEMPAPMPLSEAEEAGISMLVLDALAALRQTGLGPALEPRLLRIAMSAAEVSAACDLRQPMVGVLIDLTCGQSCGYARLLVPDGVVRALAEGTPSEPPPLADEVGRVALPLGLVAGRAQLGPHELAGLAAGDVVLFDGLSRSDVGLAGPARLEGAGFSLAGELRGEGFHFNALTGAHEEQTMSEMGEETQALPVELQVELARIRVPLAELGALRPGGVIGLQMRPTEPVTLLIDGRPVALAELVDIEGEVGARILRLCK